MYFPECFAMNAGISATYFLKPPKSFTDKSSTRYAFIPASRLLLQQPRSRIIRRVGFSENVNGIAGLKIAPGEGHIGIEREIGDRERADRVEGPDCDAFHQICRGSLFRSERAF